jgi:hypothetical protein
VQAPGKTAHSAGIPEQEKELGSKTQLSRKGLRTLQDTQNRFRRRFVGASGVQRFVCLRDLVPGHQPKANFPSCVNVTLGSGVQ